MLTYKKTYARHPKEVQTGIEQFNADLKNLSSFSPTVQHDTLEFIRRSRAIYAAKVGSGFMVCGGKLCAHLGLDLPTYSAVRGALNGGHAHAHIRGWADQVGRDHPAHKAWEALCSEHGVQPARSFETFLVRDTEVKDQAIPPAEAKLVDLLVQVTTILSPNGLTNLKQRVAAL